MDELSELEKQLIAEFRKVPELSRENVFSAIRHEQIYALTAHEFFSDLKHKTEARWENYKPNFMWGLGGGFHIQKGTKWNPGLSNEEIVKFERAFDAKFPQVFKTMLRIMNGTDRSLDYLPWEDEAAPFVDYEVHSYPRDLELMRRKLINVELYRERLVESLKSERFDLRPEHKLLPISGHCYLVCCYPDWAPVLSIVEVGYGEAGELGIGFDAIQTAADVRGYFYRLLEST